MTLIISLRIPDGIVIAGDSLATMMSNLQVQGEVDVTCPACGHQHKNQATLHGGAMPTSTFSYAQKIFPFMGDYGVGTYGLGQLVNKTIYFAAREFEKELQESPTNQHPKSVSEAALALGNHMHDLLKQQLKLEGQDISARPDAWKPLGLQVVGYEGSKATTVEVNIGKDVTTKTQADLGFTASGQINVVAALFDLYKKNPREQPIYNAFSLQDAVAYAQFVINTTARSSARQDVTRSAPLGRRSFLLWPPLRVSAEGRVAKKNLFRFYVFHGID